ncbi:MAG: sulfite oxidase, partial [Thermoplasmata archaeon]|nr:sulfite oxidase [Thermoplasmata archaeon]
QRPRSSDHFPRRAREIRMTDRRERSSDESGQVQSTSHPPDLTVVVPEPLCAEPKLTALDQPITPNSRFFVRSHFPVPGLSRETWRLEVDGEVDHPTGLDWGGLKRLPEREVASVMECAGNSRFSVYPTPEGVRWGHGAVGNARWKGVSLSGILGPAGVRRSAKEVVLEGADSGLEPGVSETIPFAMSIPLEKALEPDTILAYTMNEAPLTPDHGFPVRAIVPGWYGMASVKWVTRIHVIDHSFQGYYRTRPYVFIKEGDAVETPKEPVTRLRVKSLVTWPADGDTLSPGPHTLRGFAWSGDGAIARVDVDTGGMDAPRGTWSPARLLTSPSAHSWTPWEVDVHVRRPGYFVVRARATDETGQVQPDRAEWNFRGVATNSIHGVRVLVRPTDSA